MKTYSFKIEGLEQSAAAEKMWFESDGRALYFKKSIVFTLNFTTPYASIGFSNYISMSLYIMNQLKP